MADYSVAFKPSADKSLRKLPLQTQRRIVEAVEGLADDPHPTGSQKLQGADDLWRIRVGQYRIIYSIEDEELTVYVVRIAHRKDVYRP